MRLGFAVFCLLTACGGPAPSTAASPPAAPSSSSPPAPSSSSPPAPSTGAAPSAAAVTQADADALAASLGQVRLIDVRTPQEYAAGHVPGAVSVPLAELASRQAEVLGDGSQPVWVICEVGGRSQAAAEQLAAAGHAVTNVQGGTRAWRAAGRAVE